MLGDDLQYVVLFAEFPQKFDLLDEFLLFEGIIEHHLGIPLENKRAQVFVVGSGGEVDFAVPAGS